MNIDEYIKTIWLLTSIVLIVLAMFGNKFIPRVSSVFIFVVFNGLAGLRSPSFNGDIRNYIVHFDSANATPWSEWLGFVFGGWFEPGYSLLVFLVSSFTNQQGFVFIITLVPALIFAYQFHRYKYHPAIIAFLFSSTALVASTTTIRHYLALAICFAVSNVYIYKRTTGLLTILSPVIFHFSTIPFSVAILFDKYIKEVSRRKKAALFFIALLFAGAFLFFFMEKSRFIYELYLHAVDRATAPTGSTGLRNLVVFGLVGMSMYANGSIFPKRLNILLLAAVLVSGGVLLFDLLGLNRIVSFFMLPALVYLNVYHGRNNCGITYIMALLNIVSVLTVFLFLGHQAYVPE